jgi:hypothetical protein
VPDGHVFISYNTRNSPIRWRRSTNPADVISFSDERVGMTGQNESSATYVEFTRLQDWTLLCGYRQGSSGSGDWTLNRWDNDGECLSAPYGLNAGDMSTSRADRSTGDTVEVGASNSNLPRTRLIRRAGVTPGDDRGLEPFEHERVPGPTEPSPLGPAILRREGSGNESCPPLILNGFRMVITRIRFRVSEGYAGCITPTSARVGEPCHDSH